MGRMHWLLNRDGSLRAALTKASETKTFPRHWAASCYGASVEGDGWLEATIHLLKAAHGPNFDSDDHTGKRALPDRSGWDLGPPDGCADTSHIRFLMLTHSASVQPDDPTFFEDSEVVDFRGHGAKPTLINSAIMQSIDRDSIREQGGWKCQNEDDMPHTYAREMMNKALLLQEKVLKHLRDGGDTVGAVLTSIVTKEPPKRGPFESDALAPADDERQSQRESRRESCEEVAPSHKRRGIRIHRR